MKFPLSVRSSGASLVVAVSLLLSPVQAQPAARKPPAPTQQTPTAAATAAAANEKAPAATFDTLLSADAYGVYAEMRMVGQNIDSQEIAGLIAPLSLGGAPDELLNFYEFLKAHAEPLTTARLMFAALPVRAGLPEVLVAVEMPSVEEARKFLPELRQFIATNVAPNLPVAPDATPEAANTNTRRGRRRARGRAATENARLEADKPSAALPFQIKRSGQIIALSSEAFTFRNLQGRDQALLVNEPNFQAARTSFSSDTLFVYFNTVRMTNSAKLKSEALEKEYRRQEKLAQAETQKPGIEANADTALVEPSVGDSSLVTNNNGNANMNNSRVAAVTNANTNTSDESLVAMVKPPDDASPPPTPEATPSPKSKEELEEERQREESRKFANTVGALVFGEGPSATSGWPESIGVGASLNGDSLVVRGLFVNLADDQTLRPIPFLPVVLSGPSIAAEAPTVLPAETDIFVSASLDLPQMYDYLASLMKIMDLAAANEEGKGGLSDQLSSFEKTNNFRIREELLAALGNEIAFGLPGNFLGARSGRRRDPDAPPPPSGPIAVVALNDKKSLQELLPRVLKAIGFAGATEQSIIEKHGDVEVLTFSNGTLAFIDRFLVSAPDAATMRRLTDAYNKGETLANSERFRDSTSWQPKQGIGQVYVSNAMLKNIFEDVTKAMDDIDDEATRAYLRRLDPEPGAITHSATRESNGLMHEIHLPKNLLSIYTASEIINQRLSTLRSNESTARWKLQMILNTQNEYKQSTGRYGSLEELKAAGHFKEEYETLEAPGYEIKLSVSGDKFELTATPTGYPKQGRRSFYLDQSGDLRGGDTGGKPASASEPVVDY
jgi:hypothetical protein